MTQPKASLDDLRIQRQEHARSGLPWIIVIILLLLAAGAGAWFFTRPRPIGVQTVPAREAANLAGDRTILNASGYVTARREATISSKITAKVIEVLVEEGMRVEANQILARLDDANIKASLGVAEAHVKSAAAALNETAARIREAELNLNRVSELAKVNIAAKADLDRAEAEAASLKARLAQQEALIVVARRELDAWQQQLDDTIIRAPFAGIVTSKNAQPGEMISPVSAGGGFTRTGICTIVDMDSLEIEIDVNESYINRVQTGQPAQAKLDAYPEWEIPCKVIAIIPTADRQKSTVRVRVGFDKLDPRILPQMSVKVAFRDSGESPAATRLVVVPATAVLKEDGKDVVYVVQKGRAERRAVSMSGAQGSEAIVGAGLSAGEMVVTGSLKGLADGARVREKRP